MPRTSRAFWVRLRLRGGSEGSYCHAWTFANHENFVASRETSADDWRKVIEVNTVGVWLCMKHELAQMLKQDPMVAEAGLDPSRQQQVGLKYTPASPLS